jgi:site-specific recombinase XerD
VKKAFAGAKQRAGISRRLRMYDFRHAFATFALKKGADLKSVSRLLGHSRVDTTANIYQHVDDEMKRDAIDRLPSVGLATIVAKKKKKAGSKTRPK